MSASVPRRGPAITAALVRDLPAGLARALAELDAEVVSGWHEADRVHLRATDGVEALFAHFSGAPADVAVFEHEAVVRERIAADGGLRVPPVLARGPGWRVERAIAAEPLVGPEAVGLAFDAAERIAALSLPASPAVPSASGSVSKRLSALARSPLPARDVLRARRTMLVPGLPRRPSHGDFHPGNVLVCDGEAWIVDWERSGVRPSGFDLMRLHATLERDDDREWLLDRTLGRAGGRRERRRLFRLAHALLVRTIADKLLGTHSFDRDPVGAGRLLALLPRFRRG